MNFETLKPLEAYKKAKQGEAEKLEGIRADIINMKEEVDQMENEFAKSEDNSILKKIRKVKEELSELEQRESILTRKKTGPSDLADKVLENWKAERSEVEERTANLYYEAERILKEAEAKYKEMTEERSSLKSNFTLVIQQIERSGCIDDSTLSDKEKGNLKTKSNHGNF